MDLVAANTLKILVVDDSRSICTKCLATGVHPKSAVQYIGVIKGSSAYERLTLLNKQSSSLYKLVSV